jgi:hypothetical protein
MVASFGVGDSMYTDARDVDRWLDRAGSWVEGALESADAVVERLNVPKPAG